MLYSKHNNINAEYHVIAIATLPKLTQSYITINYNVNKCF